MEPHAGAFPVHGLWKASPGTARPATSPLIHEAVTGCRSCAYTGGGRLVFVRSWPAGKPITGQTLRWSLRARATYSQRAEHGVAYDRALRQRIVDDMGMETEGM